MVIPNIEYQQHVDYVQSANTLFHFMRRFTYLETILKNRAITPRYCIENVDFLNIKNADDRFSDIAVLQKCFCDIPLHKLADTFCVKGVGKTFSELDEDEKLIVEQNNTHFDLYGGYAIGFSKNWSELNRLQPIHYLNTASCYSCHFQNLLSYALSAEDVPELYADDVLYRLAFIKPLRGIMKRRFERKNGKTVYVDIYKNFHDECEWRYVPNNKANLKNVPGNVVADNFIVKSDELLSSINQEVENEINNSLWLRFDFDDIRYLIVPEASDRIKLIRMILGISDDMFSSKEDIILQKQILISKILVLSEIRKDW